MRDAYILLLRYLRKIWLYRRVAVAVAFLVAVPGWVSVSQMPDVYRAETRIYVDTDSMLTRVLQGVALDSSDVDAEFLRVARRTLLTRPNLERIARETDLDLTAATPEARDRLLDGLASKIRVDADSTGRGRGARENLFSVSFQHRNPNQALDVVRALNDIFIESVLGLSRRDNQKMERFLDEQIAEYERRLENAESRLATFKRENVGLLPGEGGGYYEELQGAREQVAEAELELGRAEQVRDQLQQQLELARRGELGEGMPMALAGSPDERTQRIEQLERLLDDLLLQYTENHPDVLATRRRLEQVRGGGPIGAPPAEAEAGEPGSGAGGEGTSTLDVVEQQLRVELGKAEAMVASARASVEQYRSRAEELARAVDIKPAVEAELARLNRDYGIYRRQYEALVERRESAQMSREADLTTDEGIFQVIEPPRVGSLPVAPDRPQLVTAVLGMALAAGAGVAFLLSQINATYGDLGELRDGLGVPVLGRVGDVMTTGQLWAHRMSYVLYAFLIAVLLGIYGLVLAVDALRIDLL